MLLFTVYDKKACIHKSQFFAVNKEDAIRSFYRLANDSRSDVNMFPDDFALYYVGEFYDHDGSFVSVQPVEHVIDAMSLIKVVKNGES